VAVSPLKPNGGFTFRIEMAVTQPFRKRKRTGYKFIAAMCNGNSPMETIVHVRSGVTVMAGLGLFGGGADRRGLPMPNATAFNRQRRLISYQEEVGRWPGCHCHRKSAREIYINYPGAPCPPLNRLRLVECSGELRGR
jgi:hypothetical protein